MPSAATRDCSLSVSSTCRKPIQCTTDRDSNKREVENLQLRIETIQAFAQLDIHNQPLVRRMAATFRKEIAYGIPKGASTPSVTLTTRLSHKSGADDPKKVIEVQMKPLRQGDKRTNDRYGKSAPPLRQRAVRHISM